jgi:hypothetical protein
MAIKDVVKNLLGDRIVGWLDFLQHPSMQASWGGPFNGQKFRQRIFFDLLYCFPIKAIVETGTFRGTTTALFAATGLPVYTTEIHPRFFSYSRLHFLFNRDVIHLYNQDSRSFLRALSEDRSVPNEDVFFYLDAHWGEDLPLREELEIIFSNWKRPVVMIDDFAVPNSDYGFDSYGPEKTLNLKYIEPIVSAHKLSIFFPAVNSSEETGTKRGIVVLCPETSGLEIDTKIKTLIRHSSHLQG